MPSIEESKQQVKRSLDQFSDGPDHDAILASLQDEIDRHNAVKDDLRSSLRREDHKEEKSERPMRFRFKASTDDARKNRKRSRRHERFNDRLSRRNKRKTDEDYPTPPAESMDAEPAHPFPREPVNPESPIVDSTEAFRTSLFDALADDEGAAYWESVYSQPIHIYPRPSTRTPQGKLEAMNDDEYVDYVKSKMWERKHPEVVQERKRKEKERKLEEEERARRREEFVRRRERSAWERAQGWKDRPDNDTNSTRDNDFTYEFAGDPNRAPSEREQVEREYAEAWTTYLIAWDKLKYDLLAQRNDPEQNVGPSVAPSKRIPWPVLASTPVTSGNVEAFMQHAPSDARRSKLQLLKAERVRWHPDKVQQRFAGAVDEGTMKLVTGVFQVVDGVAERERKRLEATAP